MPDDPQKPDSLGDDRTFAGEPDAPPEEQQSLGDGGTFVGERDTPPESEQSLGDQATAGDAFSSISDNSGPGNELIDAMPLVDLSERYEIQDVLGKGGMGEVLRALDKRLNRPVAIKRILGEMARSTKALSRFLTEAQSIAALNHFNIVQIYDYGRDAEGPFIIMELVEGESLQEKLKAGPLELEEAIDLICQVCDALTLAHQKGIIHRDIKPANILLTEEGVPKLTDFGLARQDTVDHGQTQAGAVLGTIDFMPLEQRRDARSDLWSLAATLYQMITGKSPKVIRLDQLPANLAPVIGTMLEEDPEERFQTAGEFKAELRKSMATAAAPVAVDLAGGVCPACDTANDVSRKFCQKCAESLVAFCLSCSEEIAVWHNVCGQCGSKQDEQRDRIRDKLAVVIEESLTLAREYEFEKALEQLNTVAKDPHAFNEDLREQATEQIELVTVQQDEQFQLRDQLVQLANQHQQAHDYAAAARELEKIPAPLRSGNPIAEQLSRAQAARDELSSLLQEISSDIKNSRIDGLLEKSTRLLELSPGNSQIQKLREQLLERQQQADDQAAELLGRAEQQYSQYEDEAVLKTLANWPQALQQPARVEQLEEMATDRLGRVQQLKEQMTPAQLALGDPVVSSVGMVLVPIPVGEFQMGSPNAEPDRDEEKPQHLVKISKPFYLGVYEVTQQQYEKVMETRPWQGKNYVKEGADYPAVYVSHDDAVEFCRRLSKQEGVEYRLPTEAEWEYACRAGTTTAYSFGDDEAKLGQYAWYKANTWDIGEEYAHGVGQKLPNPWGLYDIHGNVWEWCQDWYGSYGSEKVVSDPMGPAHGSNRRVLRGGSFPNPSSYVRSAYRNNNPPVYRLSSFGFRAARTYHLSP